MENDDWLYAPTPEPVAFPPDSEKPANGATPALPISAQTLVLATDALARLEQFVTIWASLTDKQRVFLNTWRECRFNANRALRVLANTQHAITKSTVTDWVADPGFDHVRTVMRTASVEEVLNRDHLVVRHDDIVETLLTPKAVLHQGIATGHYEVEAGAAGKANEVLLRLGGHLRDKESSVEVNLGVLTPMMMNVPIARVDGTVVDAVPSVMPALTPPDEWLEC